MLRIRKRHYDEIVTYASQGAPEEVCGILAGRDGVVSRVYPGRNVAPNPRVRYEMDPRQQFEAMREIETEGQHMVGIYHSHPHSPAYPSHLDKELAFYPDSLYVIVSLAEEDAPVMRAFCLAGGQVSEEELSVDI
ncbi:MAG: M67 family metallopeptidase [Chloroflexota bacterium]